MRRDFEELLLFTDRELLEYIAGRTILMSEALDNLKTSVSNLVAAATTTLSDVSARLTATAAGDDDADLTDLASKLDAVTTSLNQLDSTVKGTTSSGTTDPTVQPPASTTTAS